MNAMQQLLTEHMAIWTAADTEKKSGRGRASGNAGSVYGIKKLRELICELAATGRIVETNHNVKDYLLGDISEFVMGQAPPGSECNTTGDGTIFVKTGEFGVLYPEIKEWTTKPLKFAKTGDILICVVGATIGKLNLAIDCAIGRSVAAIRPTEGIDFKYLYLVLTPFTLRLREKSRGSAQGVIGKAELSLVKIRLPELEEQHRIVAKVDELMALCDQLEAQHSNAAEAHEKLVSHLLGTLTQSQSAYDFSANWQRIAAHFDTLFTTEVSIDALKQTLLQLAVMGKLVPQDANDEPASELLKRIQAEKAKLVAEGMIKKEKPLEPISENEKLFEVPSKWEWVRLADLLAIVTDGDHQAPPKSDSGIPFLVIGNLNAGNISIENCRFVPEQYFEKLDWIKKPLIDDLLYTVTGSYGIPIKVEKSQQFCVQRHVAILKSTKSTPVNYLVYLLKSKYAFEYATEIATGIAQKTVPLTGLRMMTVPIPSESEQHRIVAKVDELMALCDQLKTHIIATKQLQQKLADVMIERVIH